ncbi:hypothetical protein SDC9_165455 [bioreactor metagenome]|jgi:hypothetical protein|uniref:Uncharacterized protein n=1 Tax=bioreactor metagenome TaxID=1076179 RepID=A0A645FUC4_9ZZZZ
MDMEYIIFKNKTSLAAALVRKAVLTEIPDENGNFVFPQF